MNKEIELLYKIFELEFAPPFRLEEEDFRADAIYNKFSKEIGYHRKSDNCLLFRETPEISLLNKIKHTFNVDVLLDDDVYHIAKHLYNWFQGKLPAEFKKIKIFNYYTVQYISYPNKN